MFAMPKTMKSRWEKPTSETQNLSNSKLLGRSRLDRRYTLVGSGAEGAGAASSTERRLEQMHSPRERPRHRGPIRVTGLQQVTATCWQTRWGICLVIVLGTHVQVQHKEPCRSRLPGPSGTW